MVTRTRLKITLYVHCMSCSTLGQKLLHSNTECSCRYNNSQWRKWNLGTLKRITYVWSHMSVLVFYSLVTVPTYLYLSYAAPIIFFLPWRNSSRGPRPSHYWGFMIILRHTTLGRTPLDEWSARRTDLYLTTHNTYTWLTSMPPAGFEPAIPASERPQTHALDRVATGISPLNTGTSKYLLSV